MKYKLSDGEVTITSFPDTEDVVIPSEIVIEGKAYPVTALNNNSLLVTNIKTIHIPPTIKKIGKSSFRKTHIEAVYIEDIASWCNIDFEYDFHGGTTGPHYFINYPILGQETQLYLNDKPVEILTIPDDVKEISPFAFYNLNCKQVNTGNGVKTIGMHAFEECLMEELILGENVESIETEAFSNCKNLTRLTIPKSLRYMDYKSFDEDNITEIYAPDAEVLAFLDVPWSFYHNTLAIFGEDCTLYINGNEEPHIFIHALADRLGNYAYNGISNVVAIELEEGITSTGIFSFTYCGDLESLIFPSTLERVGTSFRDCPKLTSITVRSLVPPAPMDEIHTEFDYVGNDLKEQCTVYVPEESLELYKTDWFWSQFNNIEPMKE